MTINQVLDEESGSEADEATTKVFVLPKIVLPIKSYSSLLFPQPVTLVHVAEFTHKA